MAEVQRRLLGLGYWLSSEEHDPKALVRSAARAEDVGFRLAGISRWHMHGGTTASRDALRSGP